VRLHLVLEEDLPHPIERVWRALTDPAALAAWLMPNDFQARVGATFRMTYPPDPALRGRVDIQVLALEPPRRMAWAWAFREGAPPTTVVFELSPTPHGTHLRLTHSGESIAEDIERFTRGWHEKLAALGAFLREGYTDGT